ncbi:MAG: hypothetical protein UGF89_02210 [Acutalibacteraceae bacterium]|nr:hypothetical protein [Acutalibacteraceae bacterium]
MAKSSYFSNSAKLLSIVSALLFAANAMVAVGSFFANESLFRLGSSLSSFDVYVVLVLGYIAFNGEGLGHKRYGNRKNKKAAAFFKLHIIFCFIMNFLKSGIEMTILSVEGAGGVVARFVMSLISTAGSYGFLLCAVSFWYILRDSQEKKLVSVEVIAFAFGVLYNGYKTLNYAVDKYGITIFGSMFSDLFSNDEVMKTLCLLQFIFNIIMFGYVAVCYGKKGEKEQEALDKKSKKLPKAKNVYKDEGFGIDTMEDDFLISETIEE